jgi:hypothetical protein
MAQVDARPAEAPRTVFISYASEDALLARSICATLEGEGITTWLAERDVGPGKDFAVGVVNAIGSSRLLLVLLTKAANDSHHVRTELECAVEKGVSILPVRVEGVRPEPNVAYFLAGHQWIELPGAPEKSDLDSVAEAVQELLRPPSLVAAVGTGARARRARAPWAGVSAFVRGFVFPSATNARFGASPHGGHAVVSGGLYAALFGLEGVTFHQIYALRPAWLAISVILAASVLVLGGLLVAYSFPDLLMSRSSRRGWFQGMWFLSGCNVVSTALLLCLVPGTPISSGAPFELPPPVAIVKDTTIFGAFGAFFLLNFWAFVMAIERALADDKQQLAAGCLVGDTAKLAFLPTRVVHLSVKGTLAAWLTLGAVLLVGEIYFFAHLDLTVPESAWAFAGGAARDVVLVFLAIEALTWYGTSRSHLKALVDQE